MYKGLYDNFKHWFHENRGQVFFYSDPHFGDEEMKAIRKNYISDEEQIKRINSKIGKYDTLVILGDIGDLSWVEKIRGYKVLIMGNHDAGASNYQRMQVQCEPYAPGAINARPYWVRDNKLFNEVYEGALIISEKLILSHEPIDFPFGINIHGHDHSGKYKKDIYHWNMCAENINYTPVSLKEIIESGRLKKIDSIHRLTIDEATKKKKKRQLIK